MSPALTGTCSMKFVHAPRALIAPPEPSVSHVSRQENGASAQWPRALQISIDDVPCITSDDFDWQSMHSQSISITGWSVQGSREGLVSYRSSLDERTDECAHFGGQFGIVDALHQHGNRRPRHPSHGLPNG